MPDKPRTDDRSISRSGIFKRAVVEPELPLEQPPRPSTLPEYRDEGATTGALPIVNEGEDLDAERDKDTRSNK